MRKLYFLILFISVFHFSYAQNSPSFWVGVDGSYLSKSIKDGSGTSFNQEDLWSIRPMLGLNINDKWDIGIITNISSYEEELNPLTLETSFIIFDEGGNQIGEVPTTDNFPASLSNNLFGVGLFARRNFQLNEKFSFNVSPYLMRESGSDGNLNFYYPNTTFDPCINCLSLLPGPIQVPVNEENWRFGVDAAFAFQASNWMKLEVRANLLEFRRQTLSDGREAPDNLVLDPLENATRSYLGTYSDFGSAVSREGIRFGLVLSPF